jgi:hypothetical protein
MRMMATTMTDEFDIWIERARSGTLDDTGIAGLAERLAASGERLDPGGHTAGHRVHWWTRFALDPLGSPRPGRQRFSSP